jgi:hypothetical protein
MPFRPNAISLAVLLSKARANKFNFNTIYNFNLLQNTARHNILNIEYVCTQTLPFLHKPIFFHFIIKMLPADAEAFGGRASVVIFIDQGLFD